VPPPFGHLLLQPARRATPYVAPRLDLRFRESHQRRLPLTKPKHFYPGRAQNASTNRQGPVRQHCQSRRHGQQGVPLYTWLLGGVCSTANQTNGGCTSRGHTAALPNNRPALQEHRQTVPTWQRPGAKKITCSNEQKTFCGIIISGIGLGGGEHGSGGSHMMCGERALSFPPAPTLRARQLGVHAQTCRLEVSVKPKPPSKCHKLGMARALLCPPRYAYGRPLSTLPPFPSGVATEILRTRRAFAYQIVDLANDLRLDFQGLVVRPRAIGIGPAGVVAVRGHFWQCLSS